MTPKEKTVIRAITHALKTGTAVEMDSYATSYPLPPKFFNYRPEVRAVMLLEALIDAG